MSRTGEVFVKSRCSTRLVSIYPSIHSRDLLHPLAAVRMFHLHNLSLGPVKVIGDKGYLLGQLREGVAYNPPTRTLSSPLKAC